MLLRYRCNRECDQSYGSSYQGQALSRRCETKDTSLDHRESISRSM